MLATISALAAIGVLFTFICAINPEAKRWCTRSADTETPENFLLQH
jgi:hypothetical protein